MGTVTFTVTLAGAQKVDFCCAVYFMNRPHVKTEADRRAWERYSQEVHCDGAGGKEAFDITKMRRVRLTMCNNLVLSYRYRLVVGHTVGPQRTNRQS